MPIFTITTDHNITAFETAAQVQQAIPPGGFAVIASTQKEFSKATAEWPISQLVELWNAFAGAPPFGELKPVKKFTDRETAAGRIWKALQTLTPTPAPQAAPVAPLQTDSTTPATTETTAPKTREGSKKAIVLELIRRTDGASLKEIMDATDWQSHSVRGFISGSLGKKMGLRVESFKRTDGDRAYRLLAQ